KRSPCPLTTAATFAQNKFVGVIIILIAASLLVATGFLLAFIWSVSKGQFEDDTSPAVRMLFDSDQPSNNSNNQNP
ncbi:MAG: cbb3-type cytochrome oxidase assembly protein CcoS, partial [Bacteroidota bacterium]